MKRCAVISICDLCAGVGSSAKSDALRYRQAHHPKSIMQDKVRHIALMVGVLLLTNQPVARKTQKLCPKSDVEKIQIQHQRYIPVYRLSDKL